jgi:adenosylcobinamide kinase/adenosylcobinamide-phosphate guanylyltransferase
MNSMRHLVLGAARSGKTRFALSTAKSLASARGKEVIYVATAEAHDEEMRERIARHRAERPVDWRTHEAPRELARSLAAIETLAPSEPSEPSGPSGPSGRGSAPGRARSRGGSTPIESAPVIVVDCLTLWLSNALLHDFREDESTGPLPTWAHEREAFMTWLKTCPHTLILVSNEVGGGVVPVSALARRFQSEQGWLNQDAASICEQVTLVVAGLPVPIKTPAIR